MLRCKVDEIFVRIKIESRLEIDIVAIYRSAVPPLPGGFAGAYPRDVVKLARVAQLSCECLRGYIGSRPEGHVSPWEGSLAGCACQIGGFLLYGHTAVAIFAEFQRHPWEHRVEAAAVALEIHSCVVAQIALRHEHPFIAGQLEKRRNEAHAVGLIPSVKRLVGVWLLLSGFPAARLLQMGHNGLRQTHSEVLGHYIYRVCEMSDKSVGNSIVEYSKFYIEIAETQKRIGVAVANLSIFQRHHRLYHPIVGRCLSLLHF